MAKCFDLNKKYVFVTKEKDPLCNFSKLSYVFFGLILFVYCNFLAILGSKIAVIGQKHISQIVVMK